ncbi:MAG: PKD domain-containing protein [Bacteroidia bacterium]|nr:PKD domain-containing protein [Bacteroidia bacterium]
MKKSKIYLLFLFAFLFSFSYAQRGKDGNRSINTANAIVNEYTSLTADASAGSTSISVSGSGLNVNNRFSGNLAPGDMIMIIQMQGATILGQNDNAHPLYSTPNDATWGSVTNYNNCGKHELCQVAAVPNGTSITIDCGLINDYTALGKVQIVRVPRLNTLTITVPGVLTCQAWNGTTGGVLALEVYGGTAINTGGKISATGKGFRGATLFTPTPPRTQNLWYASTSVEFSANKGEGIAGYDNDYTIYGGKYCRGAAANAGGGGNVWNSGGGGGANAGSIAAWTGQGKPDTSTAGWSMAWNLESPGFATSTSSGGGRGGYSFSGSDQNALVDPPDDLIWGGYARVNVGGLGGRPLDYTTGRIFMGGGGGGGEQDNNQGGVGGAGGGIIYFTSYGAITGTGNDSIMSDGNKGGDSFVTPPATSYSGKDGSGGGGGGGAILFYTQGANGIVLTAKGGNGGNQVLTRGPFYFGAMNEGEGPGGGGGGGYVALTSGAATQIADGGLNGTTNSDGLTEFPPNGATKGDAGLVNQTISAIDTISAANITICSGDSALLIATINGGVPAWYSSQTGGSTIGGDSLTIPVLLSDTTFYVGSCPGTYRIPVFVTVLPSSVSVSITHNPTGVICPGVPVVFTAQPSNGGTAPYYEWYVNGLSAGSNASTFTSSALANNDTVICIMTSNSVCAAGSIATSNSIGITITPNLNSSVSITSLPAGPICAGTPVTFTATPVNGGLTPVYQWQLNGINVGSNSSVFTSSVLTDGDSVNCILISNAVCIMSSMVTSNSIIVAVNLPPIPVFTSDINTGCSPLCVQFTETSGANYAPVVYHFGDGDSATVLSPLHCYTQTGTYSVTISGTDTNNCIGSTLISNMITVVDKPVADFSVSPLGVITANTAVSFTDASVNNNSTGWDFGDPASGINDTSSLASPSHTYASAGIYCIDLIVQNTAGCLDSTNECITVTNDGSIAIPNVFTPNGDGKNDLFYITIIAVKELECTIYDRWGLKIKEWKTTDGSWDGRTKSGKMANDGVYFYVVKATANDGKILNEKGFLQLSKEN